MLVGVALGSMFSTLSMSEESSVEKKIVLGCAAATALVTAVYWCNRDPNSVKVQQAYNLWSGFESLLTQVRNVKDIKNALDDFADRQGVVVHTYQSLNARYMSWLKPWNWTADMKLAYQKMVILKNLFEYKEIFDALSEGLLSEAAALNIARAKNSLSTSYSLVSYVSCLRTDLNHIIETFGALSCRWGHVVTDALQKSLDILAGSETYVQERRLRDEVMLKERLAKAEETKASAAQTQANAALSQASVSWAQYWRDSDKK